MGRGKAPAFQFYPDAWLSSTDITLMTPAEEGAYWRLLCHEWLQPDCGLPDNDQELAVLSRLDDQWEHGSGAKIRRKFRAQNGRLYNDRLFEERKKQEEWAKKSAKGGRKSAAAKKIGGSKGGSSLVADGVFS